MRNLGITVFSCEKDEEEMFYKLSPRFNAVPTIISASVSSYGKIQDYGNQCVSVGHKSKVSESNLFALRKSGVKYISTRSVGIDHIDVKAAEKIGISIGNVSYSPDSVADYTLMLMLMAIRNAKLTVTGVEKYDFRLDAVRGKELRDMTVGVVGAGRIGKAVIDRLHGFGCRILTYNRSCEVGLCPLE